MREGNEQMNINQNSRAKFKQRVAGGAVLLIVLAIFLPFIFNHSHMGATTPVDNTVATPDTSQTAASTDQTQPAAQGVQDPAAPQQAQVQTQATDVAATASAPAAPSTDLEAPQAAGAPAVQQAVAAGDDQSMRSDQGGLTSPQSESAGPQAQAPAASPIAAALPAQPVAVAVSAPDAQQVSPETPALSAPVAQQAQTAPAPEATFAIKTKPAAHHHAALSAPTKTEVKATAKGHWLVQIGSFSQEENAQQLVSKLRAHGLHAYAKQESNHRVHVYVGPVVSQEQALKIQQQVKQEFQLSSLVRQSRA